MNNDSKDRKRIEMTESLNTAHPTNPTNPIDSVNQDEKQAQTTRNIKHPPTPLSWKEARTHLMNDVSICHTQINDRSRAQFHTMITFEQFLRTNMDMLMAFFCSALLFSLALLSYNSRNFDRNKQYDSINVTTITTTDNNVEELSKRYYRPSHENELFYTGQMVAGFIAMILSLVSIFMSWQRIKISESNKYVGLEGTLKSFASFLFDLSSSSLASSSPEPTQTSNNVAAEQFDKNSNSETTPMQLSGTSLTDIYPVYRRITSKPSSQQKLNNTISSTKKKDVEGEWHRIPKLLLVKGDYIALQVGDTTPSKVQILEPFMDTRYNLNKFNNPINNDKDDQHDDSTNLNSDSKQSIQTNTLEGGIRITLEMMQQLIQSKQSNSNNNRPNRNNSSSDILSSMLNPKKSNHVKKFANNMTRTELGEESTQLISYNNGMTLFLLKETPMISFLDKIQTVEHKSPKVHRQIQAVRNALKICATAILIITTIIIVVRMIVLPTYEVSIIWHLPLLATISILPMNLPFLCILLEIIGTARILTFVHSFTAQHTANHHNSAYTHRTTFLFLQYCWATLRSRLLSVRFLSSNSRSYWLKPYSHLLPIPPANSYTLEKLGVVTALALIDDELACEPYSTPQQLLIPTEHGMKLLDLYPTYGEENDEECSTSNDMHNNHYNSQAKPKRGISLGSNDHDSDSDLSDLEDQAISSNIARTSFLAFKRRRHRKKDSLISSSELRQILTGRDMETALEVQFEDPAWWKLLPSLKCIGLACLMVDYNPKFAKKNVQQLEDSSLGNRTSKNKQVATLNAPKKTNEATIISTETSVANPSSSGSQKSSLASSKMRRSIVFHQDTEDKAKDPYLFMKKSLVRHICKDQSRAQFLALAQSIGFSNHPKTGDLVQFKERRRLHIISTKLLQQRMSLDTHALGLEQSRLWGVLRPDSTSVIIQDKRSKSYQLLTVGDAHTVIELCADAWQGENSTISPLGLMDRQMILDTCNNWSMADLDVTAFSYAPVPYTFENGIGYANAKAGIGVKTTAYLVDNTSKSDIQNYHAKDTLTSSDWSLVSNQIFLGVLGSAVSPRKEIAPIIEQFSSSGVRFVYFSPRNMRRTKEVASQMGIDVAWNCAISLRALDDGEEDPHRMKSSYADWDVNARLPHGLDRVRKHLEEVDNVPLLVSLYTDVTEATTTEMVEIFKKYHDTVLALGLSHRSRNERTFSTADLSIGVDILGQQIYSLHDTYRISKNEDNWRTLDAKLSININSILPAEVEFVSSIVSHSCLFNLRGCSTMTFLPKTIAHGRTALQSTTASGLFIVNGSLSLSFLIFLSTCSIYIHVPHISPIGCIMYLLLLLPILGFSIAISETDQESMNRVPDKNDVTQIFPGRGEAKRLYKFALLRSLPPAILSQLTHMISFRELIYEFDLEFLQTQCTLVNSVDESRVSDFKPNYMFSCGELASYRGTASSIAGLLMLTQMAICITFASIGFVHKTQSIFKESTFIINHILIVGTTIILILVMAFLLCMFENVSVDHLSWYFYTSFFISPILCIGFGEWIKGYDNKHEKRDARFRRLKFETRLGMWSPK